MLYPNREPQIDRTEVRTLAHGRWLEIFESLSAGRLDPAIAAAGSHVSCPVHGGSDGFRLFRHSNDSGASICNTCKPSRSRSKDGFCDGFETLMWVNGWDFLTTLKEVYAHCTGNAQVAQPTSRILAFAPRPDMPPEDAKKLILEAWREAYPLSEARSELARTYLTQHRGLTVPVPDIPDVRFHPACFYLSKDRKVRATLPALLLRVLDVNGVPITLHRIYLDSAGRKASLPDNKKNMPHPRDRELEGGYVRLGPVCQWLSLSEGFENGLSARDILGLPAGCANTAWALSRVQLPPAVRVVILWGDRDVAGKGQETVNALAERLRREGRQALVLLPPAETTGTAKGADWNDALKQWGLETFKKSAWLTDLRARVTEMTRLAKGGAA